jgi:hypothetical protein
MNCLWQFMQSDFRRAKNACIFWEHKVKESHPFRDARYLHFSPHPPTLKAMPKSSPKSLQPGFKGWLQAILFYMALSPLVLVIVLYLLLTTYQEATAAVGTVLPGLLALSWFEGVSITLLSAASVVWVVVALRRKKFAIPLFLVVNAISAAYAIFDFAMGVMWTRTEGFQYFVEEYTTAIELGYVIGLSFSLPVLIALHYYFKKSKRVQLTFVK